MIPVSQKPASVVKFDAMVDRAKTRAFWSAWGLLAGGSVLTLGSYLLAGPQALMDSSFRKVRTEPIVARKLGSPLKAFGQGCECRRGRQQVAIEEYRDRLNRSIARTTFYVEGPRGRGIVDARVLNSGIEHFIFRRLARRPVFTSLQVRFPDGSVHRLL